MAELDQLSRLLISLGTTLVFAVLVLLCYRKSTANLDKQYSTFWPRFFSPFVDGLFLWPLTGFIPYILSFELPTFIAVILWFIQSIGWYVYHVYMHGKYGQTFGKWACKVKIVTFKNEKNINFRIAILRDSIPIALFVLVLIAEFYLIIVGKLTLTELYRPTPESIKIQFYLYLIPMLWLVAELVTMLTNKKRRALHDYIAGTVVVRTNITD